ncbi:MAG: hypothetical protein OEY29_00255 [Gammaproteobacteria bacterium]|nr:hypothetical protein [Gammaproteobacteria bacterium]
MTTIEILRLIAATGCGIQIGGFLLLSLLHRPLLHNWPKNIELDWLFKRYYRFNTIISAISGVFAILGEARSTGFLLAILGMSYILLLTHLLPAMLNLHQQINNKPSFLTRRSPSQSLAILGKLQITAHFFQLIVIMYIVYMLAVSPL